MEHDLRAGGSVMDRPDARVQKQNNVVKIRRFPIRPQQPLGKLVAHSYDVGKQSLRSQCPQNAECKVVNRLGQLLRLHTAPSLRDGLLAGVCPEIAVVEVQHPVDSGIAQTLCHGDGFGKVIGARTIGGAILAVGIIPQPQPNQIHSIAFQNLNSVVLSAAI